MSEGSVTHYYWEDFTPDFAIDIGSYLLEADEIMAFGRQYDPLPHHTDPAAARQTPIGTLCASGIQAVGIAQRMACDHIFKRSSLVAGKGLERMQMHKPIVAGDNLRVIISVIRTSPHPHKKDRGWVTFSFQLYRNEKDIVMSLTTDILFLVKPDRNPLSPS